MAAADLLAIFQTWLPIFFSFIALILSFFTLVWTIYKDVIRKPKFRVSVSIKRIVRRHQRPSERFVVVEALNLGPSPNRAMSVFCRKNWWRRNVRDRGDSFAFISPDFAHEAASPSAMRVEVGDQSILAFPFEEGTFLKERVFSQIGVCDGFGRMHWAPKRQLRKAQKTYLETFANDQTAPDENQNG